MTRDAPTWWWIAEGRSRFVQRLTRLYLAFREPYLVFRIWWIERRMWRREMKGWVSVFASELAFAAKATLAIVRHHVKARPRYGSAEWKAFRDETSPVECVAPWRRGWPAIADEKPKVSLADMPVSALRWPRGILIH